MLKVELWGRLRPESLKSSSSSLGKGKEKTPPLEPELPSDDQSDWKVLQEYEFDLCHLSPLSVEYATRPSSLPFNSLLVTLSSPSRTYVVSPTSNSPAKSRLRRRARSASPSTGYTSDPEAEVRRIHPEGDLVLPDSALRLLNREKQGSKGRQRGRGKGALMSAGWQDLFKCVITFLMGVKWKC